MTTPNDYLPIAIRAYTESGRPIREHKIRAWTPSPAALVIDTETTTDATQRLTFLSYRYLRIEWASAGSHAACVEEGLAFADDLTRIDPRGLEVLREYTATHPADVIPGVTAALRLLSRSQFVERVLYPAVYIAQTPLVTFNAPFDVPRLAHAVHPARGPYEGGFSFALWQYVDKQGRSRENKYRPRLALKTIDGKRSLKRLTVPRRLRPIDLKTVEDADGHAEVTVGGDLLDLRQLVYALTDQSHSLESACVAFGMPYVKRQVRHGRITSDYVDYNREDVAATVRLYVAAIEEYMRCVPSV